MRLVTDATIDVGYKSALKYRANAFQNFHSQTKQLLYGRAQNKLEKGKKYILQNIYILHSLEFEHKLELIILYIEKIKTPTASREHSF